MKQLTVELPRAASRWFRMKQVYVRVLLLVIATLMPRRSRDDSLGTQVRATNCDQIGGRTAADATVVFAVADIVAARARD